MTIFTNKIFPSGGEAGDGGGIVQVRTFHRSGPLSFSQGSELYLIIVSFILKLQVLVMILTGTILIMGSIDWCCI